MKRSRSGWWSAFAGAVAVGAALAIGELAAGVIAGVPSPLLAVARFIVDVQPPGAKELVVALFGEADKLAFQVFIVARGARVSARRSADSRRADRTLAAMVIVAFVAAGFLASLREPGAVATLAVAAAGVEALVGVWLLRRLVALAPRPCARGLAGAGTNRSRRRCPTGAAARCSAPAARSRSARWRRGRWGDTCSSGSAHRRRRTASRPWALRQPCRRAPSSRRQTCRRRA